MYGLYLSFWYLVAFLTGTLIVGVSLKPSRLFYRIALFAYIFLLVGTALVAGFPILFNIGMANAFGPSSVSPLAYLGPLLILAFVLVPALALCPFASPKAARTIAIVFFGIPLAIEAIYTVVSASGIAPEGMRSIRGAMFGFLTLFVFLLWLRVYALGAATSSPSEPKDSAPVDA